MDMCRNCPLCENMIRCEDDSCTVRDSWYVQQIKKERDALSAAGLGKERPIDMVDMASRLFMGSDYGKAVGK